MKNLGYEYICPKCGSMRVKLQHKNSEIEVRFRCIRCDKPGEYEAFSLIEKEE